MSYIQMADELLREKLSETLRVRCQWRENVISLLKSGTRQVYIFGTGQVGQHFFHDMRALGVIFQGFSDNERNKWGTEICNGLKCIPPEDLGRVENPFVFVGVGMHSKDVFRQLEEMGIKDILDATDFLMNFFFDDMEKSSLEDVKKNIHLVFELLSDEESQKVLWRRLQGICSFEKRFGSPQYFYDIYQDNQYFPDDIVQFTENDVLVDCGAYTGDTLAEFLKLKKPFKKYIAYELSQRNFEILASNMRNVHGGAFELVPHHAGVGCRNEDIYYDENISATTMGTGKTKGTLVRLSDHLGDETVSFIKMDIEGAEMDALRGAEELIRKQHPKLAICIYHKFSDLWEIPLYIKSLYPDYRLYIRHHTPLYLETVCYAIPS